MHTVHLHQLTVFIQPQLVKTVKVCFQIARNKMVFESKQHDREKEMLRKILNNLRGLTLRQKTLLIHNFIWTPNNY
jgi:hypothetical protein